jgi:hypothetical protein
MPFPNLDGRMHQSPVFRWTYNKKCPFTGDHWPQYWTKPKALYLSKLSLEQRKDLFRYFYEHEKHSAAGASDTGTVSQAFRIGKFKAYNGYSLRKVAGYFGVDRSNLKRNIERSPDYRAYVAACKSAPCEEGSAFGGQDRSVQVIDNSAGQVNENIYQQEMRLPSSLQPVHLSMGMSPATSCARWGCARTHM